MTPVPAPVLDAMREEGGPRSSHPHLLRLIRRVEAWFRWRPVDPPELLIDPAGEGVYLLDGGYREASRLLGVYFRDLDAELVWMAPPADGSDEWQPVPLTWRRSASLNLPARWQQVVPYLYFVPNPERIALRDHGNEGGEGR